MKKKMMLLGVTLLLWSTIISAESYQLDTAHTAVGFTVRHNMITNVQGKFNVFDGMIEIDGATNTLTNVVARIDTKSIDTDNQKRDTHLKSPDFFDVAKYPEIRFRSKKIEKTGKNAYEVTGELTIKKMKKTVTLIGEMSGPIEAFGSKRVGFWAIGTINRQDFGISWNRFLDRGGLVVGDEVKIRLEIAAIQG